MTRSLVDRVRSRIIDEGVAPTSAGVAQALQREGVLLGDVELVDLVRDVERDLHGAGPLEPLLRIPGVTDVVVNGPDAVWLDRGQGMERAGVRFAGEEEVRRLAQRLAAKAARRLDDASPFVDARLADGTRLHAVLPPVGVDGTLISLRVPARSRLDVDDLAACGTMDESTARLLRECIDARVAMLITGGTGSGKTTLLSALLTTVPDDERIVIVEDSTELAPRHPHAVRLQARLPNVEGAGAVSVRDLVRQALRMRPDRLILGEVRGPEIVDLLTAMNTGHEGGMGTLHANSADDVPARIEALGLMAGLDRHAVHALAAAAIEAVVHLGREDGRRALMGIHLPDRDGSGIVRMLPALVRDGGRLREAPALDRLRRRCGR